jgi:hypothetical protein
MDAITVISISTQSCQSLIVPFLKVDKKMMDYHFISQHETDFSVINFVKGISYLLCVDVSMKFMRIILVSEFSSVSKKMAVFWVVPKFQRYLLPPSLGHPDDGGSKYL